ncbi:MAG: RluA family pseudouridine synthase [Thermoguttaceae bacterium]|jgi:RluA family pseudouridine synthase
MGPGLTILYEEGPCLVVWKPAGVLTQAPWGIDSLEVRVRAMLRARDALADVYLGVPHRLDRPATGAILLAKDLRTTRKLGAQFEHRKVRKVYWACVAGPVSPQSGTWEDHVYKIPGEPRAEVVGLGHPEGRRAILHYRVMQAAEWGCWLEIELETGRTHQVRVQAASRGHPLLGDRQYGSAVPFGPQEEDRRLRAIALHARSLTFRHPLTHQLVTVTAPLPEYWPPLAAGD